MGRGLRTRPIDANAGENSQQTVEFLRSVLQASTEYSFMGNDLDGTICLWNEGARRIYGYEADEVVGCAKSTILHTPEDIAAGVPAHMLAAALRDGKWEGTLDRVRKNGDRFVARVALTPRRDGTDQAVGFVLISKDISEEIPLTQQLTAAQFFASSLIESNIDALMTTDELGIITNVNMPMCGITGRGRDELIGTRFKEYVTDPIRAEEAIRMVLAHGRVTNYELIVR